MNKYIIPTILTFILITYLTSLITFKVATDIYTEELNICKGMNNTYQQEILYRDEYIEELEREIKNESCEFQEIDYGEQETSDYVENNYWGFENRL